MDNIKNDKYYFAKCLDNISQIEEYKKQFNSYEEFINNTLVLDAIMFRLVQLIENIKGISIIFKEENSFIPWGDIMGFRNGIVHEYGKTDYSEVYNIIMNDLVSLKLLFERSL